MVFTFWVFFIVVKSENVKFVVYVHGDIVCFKFGCYLM